MPYKVLTKILQGDTTSRTAANVVSANPGMFASTNDVPIYLYTCLKDFILPGGTDPDYAKRIIPLFGAGKTTSSLCISIIPLTAESVYATKSMRDDEPGAEVCKVQLYIRLPMPVESGDFDRARNIELRIRYLIDNSIRQVARGINPDLASLNSVDNSVSQSYIKCFFEGMDVSPNEAAILVQYRIEFVRVFGK